MREGRDGASRKVDLDDEERVGRSVEYYDWVFPEVPEFLCQSLHVVLAERCVRISSMLY